MIAPRPSAFEGSAVRSAVRAMGDAARRFAGDVVDFAYPSRCAACGSAIDGPAPLCEACEAGLTALEDRPACERCAAPIAMPDAPCPRCRGVGVRPFDRVVALGTFNDPIKHLVHRMKYFGAWSVGELLAERLAMHAPAHAVLSRAQVLVPVPLHPRRQWWRGFNQAEVVARALGRRVDRPVARAAIRFKHTPAQAVALSRRARQENLRDAFAVIRPQLITGRHVAVVDDVMTSAATLRSLGRALRTARPASMSVIVLAAADYKGTGFERV